MASKGNSRKEKALTSSKKRLFDRKKFKWAVKSRAGPNAKSDSIPLLAMLREVMKVVRNKKEARAIVKERKLKVSGNIRSDLKYPVGLFDVIEIEGLDEKYRTELDSKGRFMVKKIDKKEANTKICKVKSKSVKKGGKYVIGTQDGRTLVVEKTKLNNGDSLKISLNDNKVLKELPLEEGKNVYVMGGTHAGHQGIIKSIKAGSQNKPKLITIESEGKNIETLASNIIVIEG
ncbi:MAG: KOW motif-containing protein [archaeon]